MQRIALLLAASLCHKQRACSPYIIINIPIIITRLCGLKKKSVLFTCISSLSSKHNNNKGKNCITNNVPTHTHTHIHKTLIKIHTYSHNCISDYKITRVAQDNKCNCFRVNANRTRIASSFDTFEWKEVADAYNSVLFKFSGHLSHFTNSGSLPNGHLRSSHHVIFKKMHMIT